MDNIIMVLTGLAGLLVVIGFLPPIAEKTRLPNTVWLAAVGITLGVVATVVPLPGSPDGLGMDAVFDSLFTIGGASQAILWVFLPVLLFETALAIDVRRLLDDLAPVFVMAVLAVVVSTFIMGLAIAAVTDVGIVACLMLAAVVGTTDPVAVVGLFRDLGAPKRLRILVEGESLFNDAAAIALAALLLGVLTGASDATTPIEAIGDFVVDFAGGIILGGILGWALCSVFTLVRNIPLAEVTLTVAFAYLSFIVGEVYLGVSGVITTVTGALVVAALGRVRVAQETWTQLQATWRQIGFWSNGLIFLLASLVVPPIMANFTWADLVTLIVLIVSALVARAVVLYGLLPWLSLVGLTQKIGPAYKAAMLWGGLRGAVSLVLALSIYQSNQLDPETGRFIALMGVSFILATLVIQGVTLRPLIHLLKLDHLDDTAIALRNRAIALARDEVRDRVSVLARRGGLDDDDIGQAMRHDRTPDVDLTAATAAPNIDWTAIGLVTLSTREEELYLAHLRDGLSSRGIGTVLIAQAGRLADRAKTDGKAGYEAEWGRLLQYRRHFRISLWVHRRLGLGHFLAGAVANRFELLWQQHFVLTELRRFLDVRLKGLFGEDATRGLEVLLDRRDQAVDEAMAAIELVYPDHTAATKVRFLARAALRAEQAAYDSLKDEAAISQDIADSLRHDISRRRAAIDGPDHLDLGMRLNEMIQKVPLFTDVSTDAAGQIAALLRPRLAVPGERIVAAGDRGQTMFFIAAGRVDVLVPGQHGRIRMGVGDFFGEIAVLTGRRRTADVVAEGYCQLLALTRRDFDALMRRDPALHAHIAETADRRGGAGSGH